MQFDVVALIATLGLGGVLAKFVDFLIQNAKERKAEKKSTKRVFAAASNVHTILRTFLRESNAHRVVLLKATNGGGEITLTGDKFSSVMYEDFEYPLPSIKAKWQEQLLDRSYLEMLFELCRKTKIELKTKHMSEGMLKNLYLTDGIVHAFVYEIYTRPSEYIYLSLNFTEMQESDPSTSNLFRYGAAQLRKIIKENIEV